MITGAKIIRKYETADTGKRIDIICKYYPCFVARANTLGQAVRSIKNQWRDMPTAGQSLRGTWI